MRLNARARVFVGPPPNGGATRGEGVELALAGASSPKGPHQRSVYGLGSNISADMLRPLCPNCCCESQPDYKGQRLPQKRKFLWLVLLVEEDFI